MAPLDGDCTGSRCGTSPCPKREPSTPSLAQGRAPPGDDGDGRARPCACAERLVPRARTTCMRRAASPPHPPGARGRRSATGQWPNRWRGPAGTRRRSPSVSRRPRGRARPSAPGAEVMGGTVSPPGAAGISVSAACCCPDDQPGLCSGTRHAKGPERRCALRARVCACATLCRLRPPLRPRPPPRLRPLPTRAAPTALRCWRSRNSAGSSGARRAAG